MPDNIPIGVDFIALSIDPHALITITIMSFHH